MQSKPKHVLIYETEEGNAPFSDWMDSMETLPIYDIVMTRIDRVEQGNFGEHKGVGEGIKELIIHFGPGYRVYFGQDGPADIRAAKQYWRNYNA